MKGGGWVNPNPQVGALVVKDDRIIAEGYHARYGKAHAERIALAACTESPAGATLYVTLEPCCHTGKTPPCTEAIIQSGISHVVIGSSDPNPQVNSRGVDELLRAGITVESGFMKERCDQINRIYFHYMAHHTPYVLAKYAMTLDGKAATRTGASRWISGEEARKDVHHLRNRYAAIMVGINTVLSDDPLLTCRAEGGKNPLRIVCDSQLKIPLESQIAQTAREVPTLIATVTCNQARQQQLEALGCSVELLPAKEARVDLKAFIEVIGKAGIDSILLEGGSELLGSAFDAAIVQAVRCYISPQLFGGNEAPSPLGGRGVATPQDSFKLRGVEVSFFGNDFCIEGEVE